MKNDTIKKLLEDSGGLTLEDIPAAEDFAKQNNIPTVEEWLEGLPAGTVATEDDFIKSLDTLDLPDFEDFPGTLKI